MMRFALSLCLILAGPCSLVSSQSADKLQASDENVHPYSASQKLSPYMADFSFDLYRLFVSESNNTNIFFSPMSIMTAFSLLALGAKSNTRDQILTGLRFNITEIPEEHIYQGFKHLIETYNEPGNELQLTTSNGLFIDKKLELLDKFLKESKNLFASDVFSTNFEDREATKKQINDYVEKETQGKIVDLIREVDPNAVFILVNCIYFKGKWEKPFLPESTQERPFHVDAKTTVNVPMMSRLGMYKTIYDVDLDCMSVVMGYRGNASAFFILPAQGKLEQTENALSKELVEKWAKNARYGSVDLYIPKVSISGSYDLKLLKNLGITDVFENVADLSAITESKKLKISQAKHKAVLTIDEKGSEASASTFMEAIPMSIPPSIEFNRPFLIIIYETRTKSTLFIGKVLNPTEH